MTASDVLRDVADDVGRRVGELEEDLAGLVLGKPGALDTGDEAAEESRARRHEGFLAVALEAEQEGEAAL